MLAAGGLSSGAHLAAFLTLGAAGAVVGTRFLVAEESLYSDVQKRAVSVLQNLPDGEGIPYLINVVKNTKSPEVRKQAMSNLRSSRDPRALAFFEDVLK